MDRPESDGATGGPWHSGAVTQAGGAGGKDSADRTTREADVTLPLTRVLPRLEAAKVVLVAASIRAASPLPSYVSPAKAETRRMKKARDA